MTEKDPVNTKTSTYKARTKAVIKKLTQIAEISKREPTQGEFAEHSSAKAEKVSDQPVITSSMPEASKKTERVGWWKRKTSSKG